MGRPGPRQSDALALWCPLGRAWDRSASEAVKCQAQCRCCAKTSQATRRRCLGIRRVIIGHHGVARRGFGGAPFGANQLRTKARTAKAFLPANKLKLESGVHLVLMLCCSAACFYLHSLALEERCPALCFCMFRSKADIQSLLISGFTIPKASGSFGLSNLLCGFPIAGQQPPGSQILETLASLRHESQLTRKKLGQMTMRQVFQAFTRETEEVLTPKPCPTCFARCPAGLELLAPFRCALLADLTSRRRCASPGLIQVSMPGLIGSAEKFCHGAGLEQFLVETRSHLQAYLEQPTNAELVLYGLDSG